MPGKVNRVNTCESHANDCIPVPLIRWHLTMRVQSSITTWRIASKSSCPAPSAPACGFALSAVLH